MYSRSSVTPSLHVKQSWEVQKFSTQAWGAISARTKGTHVPQSLSYEYTAVWTTRRRSWWRLVLHYEMQIVSLATLTPLPTFYPIPVDFLTLNISWRYNALATRGVSVELAAMHAERLKHIKTYFKATLSLVIKHCWFYDVGQLIQMPTLSRASRLCARENKSLDDRES